MKITTEAIVLGLRKHSDKMSVLHVYTKTEGRLALQVYGVHGKRKMQAAYQPLSIVEVTYDALPARPFVVASSVDPVFLSEQVYEDIRKQTVALFVAEILMLTVTHPMRDETIYDFLGAFVRELNGTSTPENLHIIFMIRLAELLGIGVPKLSDVSVYANIENPTFTTASLSRTTRQDLLYQLCGYYSEHIESFRMPKSLDILIEIFN